ncbi:MAG: NUDIX hydrolase [Pseudomonadota bacterium]
MKIENATAPEETIGSELDRIEALINSSQMRRMRANRREAPGYIRPKNAATMILLDGSSGEPKVLMGRRNKKLKFMPGALVFPGGSVDRHDGSVPSKNELSDITRKRLIASMRGRPTDRGARALGLAAIREVSEESGLLLGQPGKFSDAHTHWADFRENGIVPCLSSLRLFSRAVTPPGMNRRFDTWFFLAHASEIGFTPPGGFSPDGELEDLQWIAPEAAIAEDTREITRVMLLELVKRLREDRDMSEEYPAPFYYTVGSRFHKKLI